MNHWNNKSTKVTLVDKLSVYLRNNISVFFEYII